MKFLTKTDIEEHVSAHILSQITNNDDRLLDTAEDTAIGKITDMLSGMYDIETELTEVGDNRHKNLKSWIVTISVYNLYARIPDNQVPERVVKDYNDTLYIIQKIAQGKIPTTLKPQLTKNGKHKRVIRYGFRKKRNHDTI